MNDIVQFYLIQYTFYLNQSLNKKIGKLLEFTKEMKKQINHKTVKNKQKNSELEKLNWLQ